MVENVSLIFQIEEMEKEKDQLSSCNSDLHIKVLYLKLRIESLDKENISLHGKISDLEKISDNELELSKVVEKSKHDFYLRLIDKDVEFENLKKKFDIEFETRERVISELKLITVENQRLVEENRKLMSQVMDQEHFLTKKINSFLKEK